MSGIDLSGAEQVTFDEFKEPARPQDIAFLRTSIGSLPEAISALGVDLTSYGSNGWRYFYTLNKDVGAYDSYGGIIDPESRDGSHFSAYKDDNYTDTLDTFVWPKWNAEIQFTIGDGALVIEDIFDEKHMGRYKPKVVERKYRQASQEDIDLLMDFVLSLPDALKADSDRKAEWEAARREASEKHSRRPLILRALGHLPFINR